MISTDILLAASVGLLVFYFYDKWAQRRGIPPGPWGLPIVGYLPFLMFRDPIKVFEKFKEKYGKVFSLRLGKFRVVVISDYKLVMEALKQDVFMGRPAFEAQLTRNHGKKRGILFSEGKTWAEQRRFAMKNLRTFGFGKNSMESLLMLEAQELGNYFSENLGKPLDLRSKFNASVLNSLWYICTSTRFEVNDPDFQFLISNFIDNMQKVESTGLVFFFPWPLKNGLLIKGFWKSFINTRDKIQGMVRASIEEHKKTYDPAETRDYIDAMLGQWMKTDDPSSSFYKDEGDLNMLLVLVDLFLAGAETTSSTMQWAMLYMILWPEIQTRVQDEIDSVVGSSRSPTLEDKASLIYTEATMLEIHRFCSLVPFSVYHSATADTKFAGYKIPKDSVVLVNLRDAHHDKGYWGDPENFRPERWLEENGNKLIRHEAFMPFSTGKRACLGDSLAKDTLFLFFTYLMQKFRVEKVPGSGPLSLEPNARTFIVAPKPYEIIVKSRTA